jgi:hypothetical protein
MERGLGSGPIAEAELDNFMPLPNYHFSFRHSLPSDSKAGRSIPSDIFAQLVPDTESKEPQTHTTRIENDWRHGPIQIDWIDFAMHKDDASRSKRAGQRSSLDVTSSLTHYQVLQIPPRPSARVEIGIQARPLFRTVLFTYSESPVRSKPTLIPPSMMSQTSMASCLAFWPSLHP